MSSSPLLTVQALFLYSDERPLLQDVSFHLNSNETVCLVGESGSGKSLTLMSILGVVPSPLSLHSGSIHLHSRELLTLTKEERREIRASTIGFVPQSPHTTLHPLRSIGKQLLEMASTSSRTKDEIKAHAHRLLKTVGFQNPSKLMEMRPHHLSGGMKQRVLIAMALLQQPKLLLLDEPTTALDVTLQSEVLDLLMRIKHEFALSLLFVTHDLGVVSRIADRVIVMKEGKVIEGGPVEKVLLTPSHSYTKELLSACNL